MEHGQILIRMKDARDDFGFVSESVFQSPYLLDVTRVEEVIQREFHHLKLDHRLWRCVANGKSTDKEDIHNDSIYKVFITLSETARANPKIIVVA
jgi:hypothetical protein